MSDVEVISEMMREKFDNVEAHYDLSDDFFALFLDPSRIYSCAYFQSAGMSLEEAQMAKIDLHLSKLDLQPGMTLLEIGCGWGASMKRAIEKYDVNVVGLTISRNHYASTTRMLERVSSGRNHRVLLRGWEEFDEPVDRIFSVEAIEHFGFERYESFFDKCFRLLPQDGKMTIQSTISYHPDDFRERGKPLTFEVCRFIKFILTEVFPGARLPSPEMLREHGEKAGFSVSDMMSLGSHYAKTLGMWADALEANKSAAIQLQSEEVYDRYMKYLRGCQEKFTDDYIDLRLVTYSKPGAAH